mmetsp:Transcript_61296/g.198299  ORF Transcript_61296/g.198299 Transcript_61296/m.198299 type:complete len:108 (-) Transcript_61296:42-365(-)
MDSSGSCKTRWCHWTRTARTCSSRSPLRGSALTTLLRDSLGGSARTLFIATCGPAAQDVERSLATARFVARARQVQNMVAVHEEVLDAETALRSGLHAEETWLPEQP